MFEPLGEPRKLPYPLRDQISNGNITDDLGMTPNDFIWPTDPEERTIVPFYLSQREFTAIASSVDVGADIAYPQQYIEVWWLLVRSLRYRVPICEAIIDCVNSDADTKNAIVQMLIDNGDFNEYLEGRIGAIVGGKLIEPLVSGSCDADVLMGKVKALVDRMEKTNTDFLEIVEVGTNDEEKLAALVEMIPGLNQEPFADVLDFLQDILEDFAEKYAASVTEERLLEVYCALYCMAKDKPDCEINYTDVFDYFADRIGSSLTVASVLGEIISFVITGDFDTDDLVFSGMFMLQAGLVRTGGKLAGMSLPSIALATKDALPSTLYTECTDCDERLMYKWDFLPSTDGWLDGVFGSTWALGKGWHYNTSNNISIYTPSVPFDVYEIEVELTNYDASTLFYATSNAGYAQQTGRGNMTPGIIRTSSFSSTYKFPAGTRLGVTGDGPYASTQYVRSITVYGPPLP